MNKEEKTKFEMTQMALLGYTIGRKNLMEVDKFMELLEELVDR